MSADSHRKHFCRTRSILAMSLLAVVLTSHAAEQVHSLDIPSQDLASALKSFGSAVGEQVLFSEEVVRGKYSIPLRGKYTTDGALQLLLKDSGLQVDRTPSGVLLIRAAQPDSDSHSISVQSDQSQVAAHTVQPGLTVSDSAVPATGNDRSVTTLQEIVVTAQRRTQRSLDVPMSISAIDGEALQNAGVENIGDLQYVVPSLAVSEYGQYNTPAIRGIGNSQGRSSLVGTYIDEAAVTAGALAQLDLRVNDLERVEVLRGPQGTLYGEGSTSGTIRFITHDPVLDRIEGSVDASIYDTRRGGWSQEISGVLNVPIVRDVAGLRVSATYENKAGWIDQPSAGRRNINDNELSNIRTKLLITPTDAFRITAMAIVHRNQGGGYNFVNFGPREQSLFVPSVYPLAETPFSDDYEIYNLTASYDFGGVTLLSTSSYANLDRVSIDATRSYRFGALPPLEYFINQTQQFEAFTQEVRLTGETSRFHWTVGGFYRDSDDQDVQRLDFAREGTVLGTSNSSIDRTSESWAVFADASYELTERFELGLGGRYYEDKRTQVNVLTDFRQAETFSSFSPRAYLSYRLSDKARLYASVSKGFRSGGFNTGTLGGQPAAPFRPETLWSYELGTKLDLMDGRMRIDLAGYYSRYKDMQTYGQPAQGTFVGGLTSNVGEAEIYGIDAELIWRPTQTLTLTVGGNALHGEIVKVDATSTTRNIDPGDRLNAIPNYQYFISGEYRVPMGREAEGFLRASYNAQGPSIAVLRNSGLVDPVGRSDRIDLGSLQAGIDWLNWGFEIFVRNLFDETGSLTPYTWASIEAQSRPRTIGLRVRASF